MKKIYCAAMLLLVSIQLQLSPAVAGERQNPAASIASCAVRTSDIAIPMTSKDIEDIVTRYGTDPTCSIRLPRVIESIFRNEQRNEEWAATLERIINQAAMSHGAKTTGICHASLCRYEIQLTPSVDSARSPHAVEHAVIAVTSGTPHQVDSLQSYGSNYRFTIYFYSTVVPAAFLEPLRKEMEYSQ